MTPRDLVRISRPHHWVKNVFVLMPVPFALAAGAKLELGLFALGFVGFCLTSSGVYAFNDAQDAERDRLHPEKRDRPVASGRVSVAAARTLSVLLVTLGLALSAASGHAAAVVATAGYVLLNLVYSLGAKNVPLLDVFLLASYYLIRVTLGCVLVDVVPSNWLLLCTAALALFLSLAKRRADLALGVGGEHRPSLSGYDQAYLDQAMGITAATTLVAYALYCLDAEVLVPGREFASLPLVVFGVLEYLRLVHLKGAGGSPVDLLLRSPLLLLCAVGWLLVVIWSLQPGA
jgi:4-hydroxybenzoate polyprenyltransferase